MHSFREPTSIAITMHTAHQKARAHRDHRSLDVAEQGTLREAEPVRHEAAVGPWGGTLHVTNTRQRTAHALPSNYTTHNTNSKQTALKARAHRDHQSLDEAEQGTWPHHGTRPAHFRGGGAVRSLREAELVRHEAAVGPGGGDAAYDQ